jgi:hypothetical protein
MKHLAGIIPVANIDHDYGLPYDPLLMPIEKDYTMLQSSIHECAIAGCNTIWIIVNDDLSPVLRKHIGEWVYDPVYFNRTFTKFPSENRKEIPIYYVPINPKHRDRFDSYGWSILYGCYMSWYTSYKISKWLKPHNFYISFPMSVYDIAPIRESRNIITDQSKNFMISHNSETILDGLPASFTMNGEDYKKCRDNIKKLTSREYLPPGEGEQYPSKKLPLEERWSARSFDLKTVFSPLNSKEVHKEHTTFFFDNRKWENYVKMISSDNRIVIPNKELLKPRFHNKIPHVD